MKAQNSIDFSDCYMPEFGYFGKNDPGFNLDSKLTKEWEIDTFESDVEKTKKVLDTETLAKEFEALKKENEILNERLGIIESKLSKRHLIGVQNLMFSHDVIDEIWDEEDDSL